ncbi:type II secretion system protein [Nocardioides sp. URHA0032]|uniref:type II secretion system protein n=1 Tax=Nocardioides sp. URHA0032 TaxID=1380388 RepID=UPI00048FD3AD|nr:type II secretion system protein [Nocardioides sp. URHA0032]
MSPSAERRTRPVDDGFTLIEIMVAFGIVLVVLTALLPQLIVGIRSGEVARQATQAKAVAQGQLDRMRNLPYHVEPDAGDYRDVLDYYFRDTTPAGATPCTDSDGLATLPIGHGFLADGAARCSYEPEGDAYRYVLEDATSDFIVVVDTQFLSAPAADGTSHVVEVNSDYDTQVNGDDNPASFQIGVTVTVLYERRGTTKPFTTYTQIADQPLTQTRISATASATAISVGSVTTSNGAVSLDVGLLDLDGSLGFASTASASLAGASGGLSTGQKSEGASVAASAPATASSQPGLAGGLDAACTLACWGTTQSDIGPLTATDGLPNAGSVASPMQARLTGTDAAGRAISFDNGDPATYRDGLSLASPLVRLDPDAEETVEGVTSTCGTSTVGTSAFVRSLGYLRTTDTNPVVEACAVSTAAWVSLFPTDFAPRGVLRVRLVHASADCQVDGASHTAQTPSVDYEVEVKRWAGPGDDDYASVATITPSGDADLPDPATLAAGADHTVGDYVGSWSALTTAGYELTAVGGVSSVQVPGAFTLTSQPVRTGALDGVDPTSAVSFTVGEVGCFAEDAR